MVILRVLDLFSGLGGFSLGLERTGGFHTAAFCEIEPFPRAVLKKHWPEVPCYEDVRSLTADRLRSDGLAKLDVICGGFPCQDISVSGRNAGLDGDRSGLWFEYARLIEEVRPAWVIIENVAALRARGLDRVLSSLSAIGYDAEWHCISAGAIGAPHQRDRVWILAYPAIGGWREHGHERGAVGDTEAGQLADSGQDVADADCGNGELRRAGGDLVCPERGFDPEGDQRQWRRTDLGDRGPVVSADDVSRAATRRLWGRIAPGMGGEADGLPRWVDGTRPVEAWEGNTSRVVAPGAINRRPRLKAIGNSVVPAIPELIGQAILRRLATPHPPAARPAETA